MTFTSLSSALTDGGSYTVPVGSIFSVDGDIWNDSRVPNWQFSVTAPNSFSGSRFFPDPDSPNRNPAETTVNVTLTYSTNRYIASVKYGTGSSGIIRGSVGYTTTPKYNCVNGICQESPTGIYATLAECQANCGQGCGSGKVCVDQSCLDATLAKLQSVQTRLS